MQVFIIQNFRNQLKHMGIIFHFLYRKRTPMHISRSRNKGLQNMDRDKMLNGLTVVYPNFKVMLII